MRKSTFLCYLAICAVFLIIILKILSKNITGRCKSFTCLVGKTAIITGGASGIGYQVALALASRGCRIIIADVVDSEKAKERIIKETDNPNILAKHLDLGSFKSVREVAADIKKTEKKIDFLVNNAGIGFGHIQFSEDGLPYPLQVNFFGHFLLTHLLIDALKKSDKPKITWTTSMLSLFGGFQLDYLETGKSTWLYDSTFGEYAVSKFCMYITSTMLADKLKGTGITSNSAHPWIAKTNIFSRSEASFKMLDANVWTKFCVAFMKWPACYFLGKNANEGAQSIIHIISSKEHEHLSGELFGNCRPDTWSSKFARRKYLNMGVDFRQKFWTECEKLVHLEEDEKISA